MLKETTASSTSRRDLILLLILHCYPYWRVEIIVVITARFLHDTPRAIFHLQKLNLRADGTACVVESIKCRIVLVFARNSAISRVKTSNRLKPRGYYRNHFPKKVATRLRLDREVKAIFLTGSEKRYVYIYTLSISRRLGNPYTSLVPPSRRTEVPRVTTRHASRSLQARQYNFPERERVALPLLRGVLQSTREPRSSF